jgi:hypothetical protein
MPDGEGAGPKGQLKDKAGFAALKRAPTDWIKAAVSGFGPTDGPESPPF